VAVTPSEIAPERYTGKEEFLDDLADLYAGSRREVLDADGRLNLNLAADFSRNGRAMTKAGCPLDVVAASLLEEPACTIQTILTLEKILLPPVETFGLLAVRGC
jgi:hypothetical protein